MPSLQVSTTATPSREKGVRRPLSNINVNQASGKKFMDKSNNNSVSKLVVKPAATQKQAQTPLATNRTNYDFQPSYSMFRAKSVPSSTKTNGVMPNFLDLQRANPVEESRDDVDSASNIRDEDAANTIFLPFTRDDNTRICETFHTPQLRSIFRRSDVRPQWNELWTLQRTTPLSDEERDVESPVTSGRDIIFFGEKQESLDSDERETVLLQDGLLLEDVQLADVVRF